MTGQTSFAAPFRATLLSHLADREVTRISVPYHCDILTAFKECDAEGDRSAMVDHLEVAMRTYGADFDRSLENVARRQLAQLLDPGVTPHEVRNGAWVMVGNHLVRHCLPSSPALLPLRREKGACG